MAMRSRSLLVLAGIVLVGAAVGVSSLRERSSTNATAGAKPTDSDEPDTSPDADEAVTGTPPEANPLPQIVASNVPAHPADSTAQDEAAIMARLHELGETDPPLSLKLAREGNARFPGGDGAAERGWIMCKSLTNMGRFDEAYEEAKSMVQAYPNTPWAMDVTRHILVNPRTHPSERGYGKKQELE